MISPKKLLKRRQGIATPSWVSEGESEDFEKSERLVGQRSAVRQIIRLVVERRTLFFWGLVLMAVGTGATLLEPWLIGVAIDRAVLPKDRGLLLQISLFFLLVEGVRVGATILQAHLFDRMGQSVMHELRGRLLKHLLALPVTVYDRTSVGRLVTRVTNDVSALAEMFAAGFVTMAGNILIVVGTLVWLFWLDWKLALISGSVFPPLAIASIYFSKRLHEAYKNARARLTAVNAFLAENILGMRVVHLFNRQKMNLDRFAQVNRWYADAQTGTVRVFSLFQPSITLAGGFAIALVLYFGAYRTLQGDLKIGVLVAFISYVAALFQPLREIADKWSVFLSGLTSAERIFSILTWKTEPKEVPSDPPPRIRGEIEFENVWFAYEALDGQPQWVLQDLSFKVPAGAHLGVVGPTGSGKSTLIALLLRFYEPQKGRILLDGKDLKQYERHQLRSMLGLVQQDVFLFSGTLRENVLLWGNPAQAEAKDAVTTILNELDPQNSLVLDERGGNLSAGQRQKLAFARALAQGPALWILDEATAQVDSETEGEMGRLLTAHAQGKTILTVAHRLATVKGNDLILVLSRGKLLEKGSHAELVRQKGLYAKLYKYQEAQSKLDQLQEKAPQREDVKLSSQSV